MKYNYAIRIGKKVYKISDGKKFDFLFNRLFKQGTEFHWWNYKKNIKGHVISGLDIDMMTMKKKFNRY
jgi:exonuclease III